MDQLTALKKYAEDNYEQGAHWIVECWSNSEYQQLLADAGGNLSKAQDLLKLEWELICEQERAAAWNNMPLIMIIAVVLLWMQGSDEIRGYMEATNTVKGDYLTAKTNRQPFQFPEVTKSVDR